MIASATARRAMRRANQRIMERSAGRHPAFLHTAVDQVYDLHSTGLSSLTVAQTATQLQNPATGAFYFLVGYSAFGGPDIVK
jgi:uncharacterized membrane protein